MSISSKISSDEEQVVGAPPRASTNRRPPVSRARQRAGRTAGRGAGWVRTRGDLYIETGFGDDVACCVRAAGCIH